MPRWKKKFNPDKASIAELIREAGKPSLDREVARRYMVKALTELLAQQIERRGAVFAQKDIASMLGRIERWFFGIPGLPQSSSSSARDASPVYDVVIQSAHRARASDRDARLAESESPGDLSSDAPPPVAEIREDGDGEDEDGSRDEDVAHDEETGDADLCDEADAGEADGGDEEIEDRDRALLHSP